MSHAIPIAGVVIAAVGVGAVMAVPDARTAMRDLGRSTGVLDTPPKPPEAYDIIVDGSQGSSGQDLARVQEVALPILTAMSEAPGSTLAVTVQGSSALDPVTVATVTSTEPKRKNRKARTAHRDAFLAASRELVARSVEQGIAGGTTLRSSPIAETVSAVAQRSLPAGVPPETPRHLVVITDALEVSDIADFECGKLPSTAQFVRTLHNRGAFTPGSLTRTTLQFAFVVPRTIPRKKCAPMTLARMEQIRALWTAAAQSAGAVAITFHSGVVIIAPQGEEEQS